MYICKESLLKNINFLYNEVYFTITILEQCIIKVEKINASQCLLNVDLNYCFEMFLIYYILCYPIFLLLNGQHQSILAIETSGIFLVAWFNSEMKQTAKFRTRSLHSGVLMCAIFLSKTARIIYNCPTYIANAIIPLNKCHDLSLLYMALEFIFP